MALHISIVCACMNVFFGYDTPPSMNRLTFSVTLTVTPNLHNSANFYCLKDIYLLPSMENNDEGVMKAFNFSLAGIIPVSSIAAEHYATKRCNLMFLKPLNKMMKTYH